MYLRPRVPQVNDRDDWAFDRFDRPIDEWSDEDRHAERLNTEVYLSLSHARADIMTPIVNLLRSRVPIDAMVREALADAFEGKHRYGIPIIFKVHRQDLGPLGGKAQKAKRFKRDLEIGRDIQEQRRSGATRDQALTAAAERFRIGEDSCRRAMRVLLAFDRWRSEEGEALMSILVGPPDLQAGLVESLYFERVIWAAKKPG